MSRVLVTGATGFVGAVLCRELLAAGDQVLACVRPGRPAVPGARIVTLGDITDRSTMEAALAEADKVVHLAGRAHVMKETDGDGEVQYRRVNQDGTRQLAKAARNAGVKRLVLLSSVKVNGESTHESAFKEDQPPAPGDAYGHSKWQAEQALAETTRRGDMEWAVLRAPLVYGPGVRANFLSLLSLCDSAMPLPFAMIDQNPRSMIFVANLTHALRHTLDHPAAAGHTYLVRDREDVSLAELVRRLREVMGRPARLLPVPPWILRLGLGLAGRRAMSDRLLTSLCIDDSRIEEELGWAPPYSMAEGLAATIAWYRSRETAG